MRKPLQLSISFDKFLDFLVEAKKNTYAGNGVKIKKRDTSRHYVFEHSPFKYHDTYFGNLADCGREVVFHSKKPIWGMCYYGGTAEGFENRAAEVFHFLRQALVLTPREFPIRGPSRFTGEIQEYTNNYFGSVLSFYGHEKIVELRSKKLVYEKYYCGGLIKDRSYKALFI